VTPRFETFLFSILIVGRRPYGKAKGTVQIAIGRAVQVGPMNPTLKLPGTKRLKLQYDATLSNFGFKFNLRRYTSATPSPAF